MTVLSDDRSTSGAMRYRATAAVTFKLSWNRCCLHCSGRGTGSRLYLVGAALLWALSGHRAGWPDARDGWQRGTGTVLCPIVSFSHVVAYTRAGQNRPQRPKGSTRPCGPVARTPGSAPWQLSRSVWQRGLAAHTMWRRRISSQCCASGRRCSKRGRSQGRRCRWCITRCPRA